MAIRLGKFKKICALNGGNEYISPWDMRFSSLETRCRLSFAQTFLRENGFLNKKFYCHKG